jgi:hypothetical protein
LLIVNLSICDYVFTSGGGVGQLQGVKGDKAIVLMDYLYLVVFPLESIKPYWRVSKWKIFLTG